MNNNLEDLLNDDLNACKFLSLQFDESTDISDIAQLCIFEDMTSKEEINYNSIERTNKRPRYLRFI